MDHNYLQIEALGFKATALGTLPVVLLACIALAYTFLRFWHLPPRR